MSASPMHYCRSNIRHRGEAPCHQLASEQFRISPQVVIICAKPHRGATMHISRHGAAGPLIVVVLALIVAAAAIGGVVYMLTIQMPSQRQLADVERAMMHSTGLG